MANPVTRKIPCPLCGVKVRLEKSGICIGCEDARAAATAAHAELAYSRDTSREDAALARYELLGRTVSRLQEEAAEAARQEALRTKEREYSSAEREQASLELARRSLLHYTERRVPKYDASWAHELVASQIEEFLAEVAAGKSPRMILALPSRFGKALINKTKILTSNRGWTTHGELKVGDYVFGLNGKPTKVVAVSEEMPCDMEVTFSNGEVIGCHENHEWLVKYSKYGAYKRVRKPNPDYEVLETKEILRRGVLSPSESGSPRPFAKLPPTPQLFYKNKQLPIDPYVFGVHAGDGMTGRNGIRHHQDDLGHIEEIERRGYEVYNTITDKTSGAIMSYIGGADGQKYSFTAKLKELGMQKEKFIPDDYLQASIAQRYELLSGLVESDGSVTKRGYITFATTSPNLRDAYIHLWRSLGEHASVSYFPAKHFDAVSKYNGREYVSYAKEKWQVNVSPHYPGLKLYLKRKDERLKLATRSNVPYMLSIERMVEPQLGKCIQVAADDGMYLAGERLVPTHNSELASISTPLWALGHHPNWRFVLASYSDVLPVEFSRAIRAQLQGPDYRELFPHGAELSPDDASVKAWSTTQGGALRATGVGGGLLGFGADVLIVDDPVKDVETANNPDALEKLWQWFSSVAYSRLLPGGGILVIQQRLAVKDLVGRLMQNQRNEEARLAELRQDIERLKAEVDPPIETINEIRILTEEADELDESMDRWRYLEYPALAITDEYYDYSTGNILRLTVGETPQPNWKPLRKRGEALHPRRYSRSYLLKIKRNNPQMWAAMFQLNPLTNEGQYFSVTDFRRYDYGFHPKLDQLHVFCAWDLAIGTKQQNDYTVGVAGGLDHQGQLWILDLVRGKFGDVADIANRVIDLHKKWGASITGIEHTVITLALGPVLARRQLERQEHIVLTEGKEKLVATVDKQVRARSLQGLCRAGKVLLPTGDEFDGMLAELTQFGSAGVHDDQVDAASWLAILALRTPPPRDPKEARHAGKEEKKSWLDELMEEVTSGIRGYMSS